MKFMLTLLITVSAAALLNAQTTPQAPAAPKEPTPAQFAAPIEPAAAPAEPSKKIAYEIVPAKRMATPEKTAVPADIHPADISDLQKAQEEKKVKEAIEKRQAPINNAPPAKAPQKKEGATENKPKE